MMSEVAPAEPLRIGVTLGDPRGIGPEVAAAAARRFRAAAAPHRLLFIGPAGTRAEHAADELIEVGTWHPHDTIAHAGRLAGLAITEAVRLARAGSIDAIVTAPIDKAALHAGGYDFPGHTEMLAHQADVDEVVMLMSADRTLQGGPLRVVLATTHVALADVPALLTTARLVSQTHLTVAGLRDFGIDQPRVALCAFNPHAGEGGLFGDEEVRVYAPAIGALLNAGIDVRGPIPADTVFLRAARGEFDVVIAPYHDVGMAAFKTAAFGSGVNVTLGLPFPRTSPDHGTALDLVGHGTADASSMHEALMLAVRLAAARRNRSVTA
jgi:4-hydroxythreonine-4-phosphate dehydrogenase